MKTYQIFQLLGDATALHITSEGYMPLSIENIGQTAEGQRLIAMPHTAEQNGDLMRDPEVVFLIHDWKDFLAAEPISFRNDFTGMRSEVYRYNNEDKRTHVVSSLKKELKIFASLWFRNLRTQGFYSLHAKRERLA